MHSIVLHVHDTSMKSHPHELTLQHSRGCHSQQSHDLGGLCGHVFCAMQAHLQLPPGALQLVPVLLDVPSEGVGQLLGVLGGLQEVSGLLQLWLQVWALPIQVDGLQWYWSLSKIHIPQARPGRCGHKIRLCHNSLQRSKKGSVPHISKGPLLSDRRRTAGPLTPFQRWNGEQASCT